jgi:hypothetical protein
VVIFPRKNMQVELTDATPPESIYVGMDPDWHFYEVIQTLRFSRKTSHRRSLDRHCSHARNLGVVKLGRENDVSPPFLHKMQPLDLAGSRDISVGIETWYGPDGLGLVSGRDKRFFSSQSCQILMPTQTPIQWIPCAVSLGAFTSI